MQQGHPRKKQLKRARHEMYMHRQHKAEEMAEALRVTFKVISEAITAFCNVIVKYFNSTH